MVILGFFGVFEGSVAVIHGGNPKGEEDVIFTRRNISWNPHLPRNHTKVTLRHRSREAEISGKIEISTFEKREKGGLCAVEDGEREVEGHRYFTSALRDGGSRGWSVAASTTRGCRPRGGTLAGFYAGLPRRASAPRRRRPR